MKTNTPRLLLAAVALAALAACSTTPPTNSAIEDARVVVQQARGNPYVAKSGSLELERAEGALRRAEASWADNRDEEQARHLAYLARQRAEVALAVGSQAQYDERLANAGAERERTRLEARTREADRATANARAAQASATVAQSQAEMSRAQADAARQQAEASRAQADAARVQASQQAERAAALERDLQSLQARNTDRGMVVTIGDVLFDTGRATLRPTAQRDVDKLAEVLKKYPERKVKIEGYTDSVGSDEMNMELSRRRAEAFQNALSNDGVPSAQTEVRAFGEANPVADNATAQGRQQNRRVEVLFSDPDGRFATK